MILIFEDQKQSFKVLLDNYHQCFYDKNIDALRAMYVTDEALVYFDNHADCDSRTLVDHLQKFSHFFDVGNIVRLDYEDIVVYEYTDSALLLTTVRYSSQPKPGVRASFF